MSPPAQKPPPLGMVEDDRFDAVVIRPFAKRRAHSVAHLQRQSVERLGPVERDMPHRPMAMDVDLVCHIFTSL